MVSINHDLKAIFIHLPKNGGSSISSILHNHYGFDGVRAYRTDHCLFNEDAHNIKLENYEQIDSTLHKRFVKMHATYNIRRRGIIRYFRQENIKEGSKDRKKGERTKIFYLRKAFSKVNDVAITDKMWDTYFKFVFIRNPYDRVISGWKFSTRGMPIRPKLIDFMRNKHKVTNVAYSHTFITQKAHLVESDDKTINFDYYGDFNNLNEELIKVLLHLGVKTIKHEKLIEKDIIMNKGNEEETKTPYYKYYENQEILDLVNNHFKEDFEYFGYKMYEDINDLKLNYDKILSVPMTNRGNLNKTLCLESFNGEKSEAIIKPSETAKNAENVEKPKAKRGRKKKVVPAKPTDPTAKPTDPTAKPTDPTAKPTDPTAKPTDPTATPTASDPTAAPTASDPTAKPTASESELYRINNIKKLNKTLISELKEKKLLEENDNVLNIKIDEKNRHLIDNVANRLFKKKCIPNVIFMKQATCCGHTANCGCEHTCDNMIAMQKGLNNKMVINKQKMQKGMKGAQGMHRCDDVNCILNMKYAKEIAPDISKLYLEYKKNKQSQNAKAPSDDVPPNDVPLSDVPLNDVPPIEHSIDLKNI